MRTPIISEKPALLKKNGRSEINYSALCTFAATGFFLEKDSYFAQQSALQPATSIHH